MDLRRESRYIISSFIIIIVCWLGWLCGLVFGQVGEAFTSAVNFPDVGLICLANLAAFYKIILRNKHFHETDGKETLFLIRNLERNINDLEVMTTCGENLQNCSVVMLSFHYPATSGERKFMSSISIVSDVHSIFLRCRRLQCGAFTEDFRKCSCTENRDGRCGCIVFNTVEDITLMLARRIPGTMKRLPHSQCLLPSLCCLRNGCHDCNQGLLHVEINDRLRESNSQVEPPAAVCEILESIHKESACICIPLFSANDDEWTNELIRIFKHENRELRGVVFREGGTNASALENYKNRNGECDADETYSLASLAIVPNLAGALIMFVLTFLLKVDGFSSAMLAQRSVSGYSSSQGRQIFPHEYLTRARVKSNANYTNVCQVFFFRPAFQFFSLHILWLFPANTCCFGWMVLVAMEGGAHTWYHIPSMAPSEGRTIVIIVATSIALAMDLFDLKLYLQIRRRSGFRLLTPRKIILFHNRCRLTIDWVNIFVFCLTIGVQLIYVEQYISIARGRKAYGTGTYIGLQLLALMKWGASSIILTLCQYAISHDSLEDGKPMWWYGTCGRYIGASAFLLNATLAGVRAQWKFS